VLESVLGSIFDLLFPRYCFHCQELLKRDEILFCRACQKALPLVSPGCPICEGPSEPGHLCPRCASRFSFERVLVPFYYAGPIAEAVKFLKYEGRLWLARELIRLWKSHAELPEADFLIPVPLHPSRLYERGFNQSLLFARFLDRRRVLADELQRLHRTRPQTGLSLRERQKNVRRAFALRREGAVRGKSIVLVDDVLTTGATVEECARVLKKAGAKEISVALLARAR